MRITGVASTELFVGSADRQIRRPRKAVMPAIEVLRAPRLVTPDVAFAPGWVSMADGRVVDVGEGTAPSPAAVTELSDGVLVPGLIDAQINGAFGVDFAAADAADWRTVLTRLPSTGATSVVPTFITAPLDELIDAVLTYRRRRDAFAAAAGATRTLGVHLEGPFLSEERRGAHDAALLRDPDDAAVKCLIAAADDGAAGEVVAIVTVAPERRHALAAIRQFVAAGVRVSVGHSDATDEVVRQAADAGATMVTHLYNAQRPLHHRDPGVVGAGLTDERFTLGLIADLHHVAPTAVRLAFAAAPGRVALITDAVAALGMPPGRYELGGQVVEVADSPDGGAAGTRPPLRPDGTIAGSALRMDRAVACGVPLTHAVAAATTVPAGALGRRGLGRLEAGAHADIVWLGDDLTTRATWIGGTLAYGDDFLPDSTTTENT